MRRECLGWIRCCAICGGMALRFRERVGADVWDGVF